MDREVKLFKGYWWSAGRFFGWNEKDPGVGISIKEIEKALPDDKVIVISKYETLEIKAKKAMEMVSKYGSKKKLGNTWVGVIPKSSFTKVES